jgi:RHS repeat-associated protein
VRSFVFNGDNKQTQVKDVNGASIGTYYYDGEGKRVKKTTNNGEVTVFVYDGMGKLVAEYSNQAASSPTISYTTTDHLGSPRVITDKSGNVTSRRDFMPFGEDLNAGTPNRATAAKYTASGDTLRKKFTGYEKDTETGLDFAEARYYNNQHGRFTAVDPLLASGKSANPQTFNRYIYVINNPLVLKDKTGLQASQPVAVPDDPIPFPPVITSARDWLNQFYNSLADQANTLVNGISGVARGNSSMDRLNQAGATEFQEWLNHYPDGRPNRILGNQGAYNRDVIVAEQDAFKTAQTVGAVGHLLQGACSISLKMRPQPPLLLLAGVCRSSRQVTRRMQPTE